MEIVHLIEGLKGDNLNENANQHFKKVNSALLLNDHKKQHPNKKPIHSKKSSELIRLKTIQISDILERYIALRETQDWN